MQTIDLLEFTKFLRDECGYFAIRFFPNERYCAVSRLSFHYAMIIGDIGDRTSCDRYCYTNDLSAVIAAVAKWNGEGEPEGWHRHPKTGRRRPDGDPVREYIEP